MATEIERAFDPLRTAEKRTLAWDFKNDIPSSVTISTAHDWVATVKSGTDASPSDIISGSAAASGTKSQQLIDATLGVEGVEYYLEIKVTLSDGQVFEELATVLIDDAEV